MSGSKSPSPGEDDCPSAFQRIGSYPVIYNALVVAQRGYFWLKSSHAVVDTCLSIVEDTFLSVKVVAGPIVATKLKLVDRTICNHLDSLERMFTPSIAVIRLPVTLTAKTISTAKSLIPSCISIQNRIHTLLDKSEGFMNSYRLDEEVKCKGQDSILTKVIRLARTTQHQLYLTARNGISAILTAGIYRFERQTCLEHYSEEGRIPFKYRVVEGCESTADDVSKVEIQSSMMQNSSGEMDQLQDILVAMASVKKYATTNTLISLYFLNSNLSLLKTVLLVNEKLLHQCIKIIAKLQFVIEYGMCKVRSHLRSQKIKKAKYCSRTTYFVFEDSDFE